MSCRPTVYQSERAPYVADHKHQQKLYYGVVGLFIFGKEMYQ